MLPRELRVSAPVPAAGGDPSVTPEEIYTQHGFSRKPAGKPVPAAPSRDIIIPGRSVVSPGGKVDYQPGDIITQDDRGLFEGPHAGGTAPREGSDD